MRSALFKISCVLMAMAERAEFTFILERICACTRNASNNVRVRYLAEVYKKAWMNSALGWTDHWTSLGLSSCVHVYSRCDFKYPPTSHLVAWLTMDCMQDHLPGSFNNGFGFFRVEVPNLGEFRCSMPVLANFCVNFAFNKQLGY